jgi:mRNA-degrading endonuclease YafQ of YafQ-DinJ toxin-antitoxin module
MIVRKILYGSAFVKRLRALDPRFQRAAVKAEAIFRTDPLHTSLRLHRLQGKLEGLHSISVTRGVRIIFKRMENGDILFISIGRHDIYRSL